MKDKIKKSLYEIYNFEKERAGESFTMCDNCYKEWFPKVEGKLYVNKIAEKSLKECNECGI
jgi:hypothetical protein